MFNYIFMYYATSIRRHFAFHFFALQWRTLLQRKKRTDHLFKKMNCIRLQCIIQVCMHLCNLFTHTIHGNHNALHTLFISNSVNFNTYYYTIVCRSLPNWKKWDNLCGAKDCVKKTTLLILIINFSI